MKLQTAVNESQPFYRKQMFHITPAVLGGWFESSYSLKPLKNNQIYYKFCAADSTFIFQFDFVIQAEWGRKNNSIRKLKVVKKMFIFSGCYRNDFSELVKLFNQTINKLKQKFSKSMRSSRDVSLNYQILFNSDFVQQSAKKFLGLFRVAYWFSEHFPSCEKPLFACYHQLSISCSIYLIFHAPSLVRFRSPFTPGLFQNISFLMLANSSWKSTARFTRASFSEAFPTSQLSQRNRDISLVLLEGASFSSWSLQTGKNCLIYCDCPRTSIQLIWFTHTAFPSMLKHC